MDLLLASLPYSLVAAANAAVIIYFHKKPLNSELFKRFIPYLYLNFTTFFLLIIFDYHYLAYAFGRDAYEFFQTSIICDVWYSTVNFLTLDITFQAYSWHKTFRLGYGIGVAIFMTAKLTRHFSLEPDFKSGCYRIYVDTPLLTNISMILKIFGLVIVIGSLIFRVNLDRQHKAFFFVLLLATAVEIPEWIIKTFDLSFSFPFYYYRYIFYGMLQLAYLATFFEIGRKIKLEKTEEAQFSFDNQGADNICL